MPGAWDYLILTASNAQQARAYETHLRLRTELGLLPQVRRALVIPDPDGRRVGSGGSTLHCLNTIRQLEAQLEPLRILIVHAGGDSRRLPAYSPCGKIFVPIPGRSHSALGLTLFDRLVPTYLGLETGRIVVATGDALLQFDPESAQLNSAGMTLLASYVTPEEAARHGVYCVDGDGRLRLYLQKPCVADQSRHGAIDRLGRATLDIGVMSFDASTAELLLDAFPSRSTQAHEIDLYREICCALGSEATFEHYVHTAKAAGSPWNDSALAAFYAPLRRIATRVQVLPRAAFLHFGATGQLISSGRELSIRDGEVRDYISLQNEITGDGRITGQPAWLEGCSIKAPLTLGGYNVIVGVDIETPLWVPSHACLDVLPIRSRIGCPAYAIRCYGLADSFKDNRLFGAPLPEWLPQGALWEAPIFPAEASPDGYRRWLWMLDIHQSTPEQRESLLAADRYSAAELAIRADQEAFHSRRMKLRAKEAAARLESLFTRESTFSAADLEFVQQHRDCSKDLLQLAETYRHPGMDSFVHCRILHSLGTATHRQDLCAAAFRQLHATILTSSMTAVEAPRNALRPDETIWGRGPARIELGGGWTDTPPYTLEHGGDVINVAVNLNGQPPIHCYCRVVSDPVIRLSSIDGGEHIEIQTAEQLRNFHDPEDRFALAKAALVISGFNPRTTLRKTLEEFGGGIELTTLVGIPKGSGLGTSSILGAVIMAVLRRMMGRAQSQRELFHEVLRLEQALTTGGGWQDQIGGGVGGAKLTSTRPGLFPDPSIHYIPADLIDPKANGGTTLLYYTGLTRLAKNILQQIVGGYLNRDRAVMQALTEEHEVARAIADAMSRKDAREFGSQVNRAWELQKRLCGTVTNEIIESLLARVRPHVHGMRISGAGSGGFLLMICKSAQNAAEVKAALSRDPPNPSARFFDFEINQAGLEVTTC
jgi:fucokinase